MNNNSQLHLFRPVEMIEISKLTPEHESEIPSEKCSPNCQFPMRRFVTVRDFIHEKSATAVNPGKDTSGVVGTGVIYENSRENDEDEEEEEERNEGDGLRDGKIQWSVVSTPRPQIKIRASMQKQRVTATLFYVTILFLIISTPAMTIDLLQEGFQIIHFQQWTTTFVTYCTETLYCANFVLSAALFIANNSYLHEKFKSWLFWRSS